MQEVITVFCAFTRAWAVDEWIRCLENQNYDKSLINLCFIVDADEVHISGKLNRLKDKGYRSYQLIMNEEHSPNEPQLAVRRKRIAWVKNQSKELIEKTDCKYVVSFEDDTVFNDAMTIQKLLIPLNLSDDIGFVEGVQCGRWGVKMIGAWKFDNIFEPTRVETMLPPKTPLFKGMETIDAGGFYGYATHKDMYLSYDYAWTDELWGPDVNFGLWLGKQGYRAVILWELPFGHRNYNQTLQPTGDLFKVVYNKDPSNGQWRRSDAHEDFNSN